MNSKNIVIIVAVLFVAGVAFFIKEEFSKGIPTSEKVQSTIGKNDLPADSSQSEKLAENSKYLEYSNEVFEKSENARRVLFFYASWCPICIPADKDFRENQNKFPEDLVLIRVNYNDPETDQEEKDLAKKYAVTYQHTFVQIDSVGNEVNKWNGGETEELLKNLK